jgi:(S)-ureidoglycine aminohydrolase
MTSPQVTQRLLPELGQTRTRVTASYAFIAPDGHVQTSRPDWRNTQTVTLISPQMGARFSQYLVTLAQAGHGAPAPAGLERFVYVTAGEITLQSEPEVHTLASGSFAYLPAGCPYSIHCAERATLTLFERRYIPLPDSAAPGVIIGHEGDIGSEPFLGDPDVQVKRLLPDTLPFDMAVNTMSFAPGSTLPFAETHVMEHGMLMLRGGGIYRLGDDWHPITEGDVLWLGPYCTQWFGALGREWSSYLLYKEVNRDVFTFERES